MGGTRNATVLPGGSLHVVDTNTYSGMTKRKEIFELMRYAIPSAQKLVLTSPQAQSHSAVSTGPYPLPGPSFDPPRAWKAFFKLDCGDSWTPV